MVFAYYQKHFKMDVLIREKKIFILRNCFLLRIDTFENTFVCMYVCMYLMIGKGQIAQKRPYWGENRLKSKIYG